MKKGKLLLVAAIAATTGCQAAPAVVNVDAHIVRGGPRAIAYHPIYNSGHFYDIAYAPSLLFVPHLGFYVSVGQPYDMLFLNSFYYVYHSGYWYHSRYYRGPWAVVKHNRLPHIIRKHRWHKIRDYCEREYRKHTKHRWLKHRHNTEEHRKIRQRAHDDEQRHHSWKAHKRTPDYERRQPYKDRSKHETKKAYWAKPDYEKRAVYKGKETRKWRRNSGEKVIVTKKTRQAAHWKKQDNDRNGKRWAKEQKQRWKNPPYQTPKQVP